MYETIGLVLKFVNLVSVVMKFVCSDEVGAVFLDFCSGYDVVNIRRT
jgi:hypothetical protein